jgi:hypothetical protein
MNSFSFFLLWKVFISPPIMKDSFARKSIRALCFVTLGIVQLAAVSYRLLCLFAILAPDAPHEMSHGNFGAPVEILCRMQRILCTGGQNMLGMGL